MIVKVFVENTTIAEGFQTEHGLSLYIETARHKILFDMGASGLFRENAQKLRVDLAGIDFAVISHGHHDHGGGLKVFLEHNTTAPVYLQQKAFEMHCVRRPADGSLVSVGLEEELKHNKRIILTGEHQVIAEGIELFSNVRERELFSAANKTLLMEKDGVVCEDTFEHEQNLIIEEDGKIALFAGCAHNGIANIVRRCEIIKGRQPDYVFGGFHLYNPTLKKSESPEFITQLGEFLKTTSSKYYTGHCTGQEAFHLLKNVLGEQLQYLATGSVIFI